MLNAPAERLPLADASVDAVVSTGVLCTVDDPAAALAEARRVLRPGGRLLFIEHVRAEGRAARRQDRITPLWRRLNAGCRPNRDTVAAITGTGFAITDLRRLDDVPAPPWIRPLLAGVAVAPADGG